MRVTHVHETVLYGRDLDAMRRFYREIVGLLQVSDARPRGMAFRVDDRAVLLVFDPSLTREAHRDVPSHGAEGAGHVAFGVEAGSLGNWRDKLVAAGLEIEREMAWETGARSVYVRDPGGNSVEFVEGDAWPKMFAASPE